MAPVLRPSSAKADSQEFSPQVENGSTANPPDNAASRARSELESIKSGFAPKKDRPQITKWSSGSWRGKATAVAGIAHETVSAGEGSSKLAPLASGPQLSRGLRRPLKSRPSYASITNVHITTGNIPEDTAVEAVTKADPTRDDLAAEDISVSIQDIQDAKRDNSRPLPPPGWRGWWTKPNEAGESDEKIDHATDKQATPPEEAPVNVVTESDQSHVKPIPTLEEASNAVSSATATTMELNIEALEPTKADASVTKISGSNQPVKSWFGIWNAAPTGTGSSVVQSATENSSTIPTIPSKPELEFPAFEETSSSVQDGIAIPARDKQKDDSGLSGSHTSGGWAFWSRAPTTGSSKDAVQETSGEVAVAGTASQANPEPPSVNEQIEKPASNIAKPRQKSRPVSLGNVAVSLLKGKQPEEVLQAERPLTPPSAGVPEIASHPVEAVPIKSPQKCNINSPNATNLLLPAFRDTFREEERPSYVEQLLRMLGQSPIPKPRHLFLSPVPPRIQNALAIGVHGYFPSPLIQKVIGQPTGTSIRFANGAAAAIQEYAATRGYSCSIEKVALEGEGIITERVDALWKLLLNWLEQIRKADFIMVACHSQGVPVAIMLVAKLLELKCIAPSVRIGVCAMAGVNLGPFSSYQSRYFGGSAAELFEFARPASAVSTMYRSALETALKHHVRLVYIGSIDDQLVSLESSTFGSISHPYIQRAVFIDGRLTPQLRNVGVSDHGLIRELSTPLAGSLYGGEGHSRIYEDPAVYALAVEFTNDTANLVSVVALGVEEYEVPTAANSNPYFLPWAMRGVLEEEYVKTEQKEEVQNLLDQFESWKPSSKVLKDVKFRLEAVKSKLGSSSTKGS